MLIKDLLDIEHGIMGVEQNVRVDNLVEVDVKIQVQVRVDKGSPFLSESIREVK
jgi:hypothetical protein